MNDVFLSRPNWLQDEYKQGIESLCDLLKSHDINPRTIGQTDFPSMSPMDGVIELLEECEGAIILGYPQIEITAATIKGVTNSAPFCLGTEWNHIEAGLAYAIGLPLLVIHDFSVGRGIFDRGVLNSFLYQKDFKDPAWPLATEIIGSIKQWKSKLRKPIIRKRTLPLEKPKYKWGCYQFENDSTLYCPVCYEKDALKIPTSRVNSTLRMCPNCKAQLR
jgi:hypothetical protein